MRYRQVAFVAAGLVMAVTSACTGDKARTVTATSSPTPKVPYAVNIDPSAFGEDSANIDNPWLPLKPGTQFIWEGSAFDGEDEIERRVVFTITDLTKEIAGVRMLVGWDRDFNDGKLAESELIFLAQDKQGNVWHFGQHVELWSEEGEFDAGRAWVVGYVEGAKAGIMMQAAPTTGTPAYAEGFAPAPYFWDDRAKVYQTGQKTCVPAGCYSDVTVIEEFEPSKPDAFQLKYYARGVGNVRVGWRGAKELEKETLELIKVLQLGPAQLDEARAEALKIEARANVYGRTPPLQRRPEPTASPSS